MGTVVSPGLAWAVLKAVEAHPHRQVWNQFRGMLSKTFLLLVEFLSADRAPGSRLQKGLEVLHGVERPHVSCVAVEELLSVAVSPSLAASALAVAVELRRIRCQLAKHQRFCDRLGLCISTSSHSFFPLCQNCDFNCDFRRMRGELCRVLIPLYLMFPSAAESGWLSPVFACLGQWGAALLSAVVLLRGGAHSLALAVAQNPPECEVLWFSA